MICTDFRPIQMSPASNLILQPSHLKVKNSEYRRQRSKAHGKRNWSCEWLKSFKIITTIKKHKCGFMKEIYPQPQIMKSALQDIAFLVQPAEPAAHKEVQNALTGRVTSGAEPHM